MSLLPNPSWGRAQAHLPSMPHCDEGTDGLEGSGATGQQVGPVVGLQDPHEVGTLCLQEKGGAQG